MPSLTRLCPKAVYLYNLDSLLLPFVDLLSVMVNYVTIFLWCVRQKESVVCDLSRQMTDFDEARLR